MFLLKKRWASWIHSSLPPSSWSTRTAELLSLDSNNEREEVLDRKDFQSNKTNLLASSDYLNSKNINLEA